LVSFARYNLTEQTYHNLMNSNSNGTNLAIDLARNVVSIYIKDKYKGKDLSFSEFKKSTKPIYDDDLFL
jgi:hypothetical protein